MRNKDCDARATRMIAIRKLLTSSQPVSRVTDAGAWRCVLTASSGRRVDFGVDVNVTNPTLDVRVVIGLRGG